MPVLRHDPVARLQATNPTIVGGVSDRAANVRTDLEGRKARGDCHSCPAGRAARGAVKGIWIVTASEDRIVRLPVGKSRRHIRLAKNDSTCGTNTSHDFGVLPGSGSSAVRQPPCRGHAGNVDGVLDGNRQAVKKTSISANACFLIGTIGRESGPISVYVDDRIYRRVPSLDSLQIVLKEVPASKLPLPDPASKPACGSKSDGVGDLGHDESVKAASQRAGEFRTDPELPTLNVVQEPDLSPAPGHSGQFL